MPLPNIPSSGIPGLTQRNIEAIAQLEAEFRRQRTRLDRVSDTISAFVGSVQFVIAHATGIGLWVLLNAGLLWFGAFDPYPFVFLNLVLAVETVFLSTFVLMSQNRQNHQADRWAHLNLQLSMLSEQEMTKVLQLLQQVCDRLGIQQVSKDRELREMVQTTQVEVLAEGLDQAREAQEAAEGAEGAVPTSEPGDEAGKVTI